MTDLPDNPDHFRIMNRRWLYRIELDERAVTEAKRQYQVHWDEYVKWVDECDARGLR